MQQLFFTYILLCSDGSYYVGFTSDMIKRLNEHNSDEFPDSYCFDSKPIQLVFIRVFFDSNKAISFEKQVKRWSRKKKEALIFSDFETLHKLAACKNSSSHTNLKI